MAIKPILFNTEMVRAIMDGRKSCTRRMVKPQPDEKHTYPLGFVTDSTEKKEVGCFGFGINEYGGSIQYAKPQYQPGDLLYVGKHLFKQQLALFGIRQTIIYGCQKGCIGSHQFICQKKRRESG